MLTALTVTGHGSPLFWRMDFGAVKSRVGGGQLRKAWPLALSKQDKLKVGSAQSSLGSGDRTGSSPVLRIGGRNTE